MAPRHTWTFPELRSAKSRVEAGETWDQVAASFGVNTSTLRKQVYTHLGSLDLSKRPRVFAREVMILEAIRLRNTEKLSYALIKDRIGWDKQVVALRQAVKRYAAHHELELHMGKPLKRRCRWSEHE
jgi:hypothetical protein